MNKHAKYPVYNYQDVYSVFETTQIVRKNHTQHPTVVVKYKTIGFTNEDSCIEASFSPVFKDTLGKNVEQDIRSFFRSLNRFVSIFQVKVTYDDYDDSNKRVEEIVFNTDFPN